MLIRPVQRRDAAAIAKIYNHYIRDTVITFEEHELSVDALAERIDSVTQSYPWFVGERDDVCIGYAYANQWRARSAYRHAVESSVYVRADAIGQGFGRALYLALLDALRQLPIHSVIGGIALPNDASVALHERLGFTKVGHFTEVGRKFDEWIDVGYWELLLDGTLPA